MEKLRYKIKPLHNSLIPVDVDGICLHCGVPVDIVGDKEKCNHVYYPSHCDVCSCNYPKDFLDELMEEEPCCSDKAYDLLTTGNHYHVREKTERHIQIGKDIVKSMEKGGKK